MAFDSRRLCGAFLCALLLGCALLAGCASSFTPTNMQAPPEAVAYVPEQDAQVDTLLTELDRNVVALFGQSDFTISEQQSYTTTLALDTVTQFYLDTLPAEGWSEVTRVPSGGSNQALLAYQRRNQLFVVAAIDLRRSAGPGVLVYTVLGQR